jgi:hypothetical protein
MRLIARAAAVSAAAALLALAWAAAALAQQLPSDADTPTDSPSAWDGIWPWLLIGVGMLAFLGLLAFGLSWQRARAPAQPPAAASGGPAPASGRPHAKTCDIAVLTFDGIPGAEQGFAAVREKAPPGPWLSEVAFAERHRHGRIVVRGTFAGRYLDIDGHAGGGPLLDELRADVPEGSSALVVYAAGDEVDQMIDAFRDSGATVTRHRVTAEAAAELEASVSKAPPAAPPPAAV